MGLNNEQIAHMRHLYRTGRMTIEELAHYYHVDERRVEHLLGIRPAPFNMHLELDA